MAEFLITPDVASPAAPSSADIPPRTKIDSLADVAVGGLIDRFRKPNIIALLRALVEPMQPLEDALWQLFTLRLLSNATGAQLDTLGQLVGQPRAGHTDEVYRAYIRAKVVSNRSHGQMETLILICRLVIDDDAASFYLERQNYATLLIRVDGIGLDADTAQALYLLLQSAASSAVRIILEFVPADTENAFRYDIGPGYDVGHYAGSFG